MIRERMEEGGAYLKAKHLMELGITAVRFNTPIEETTYTFDESKGPKKRMKVGIAYDTYEEGKPDTWSMNPIAYNTIFDVLGVDDEKWYDIDIPIVAAGQGQMANVQVNKVQLIKNKELRIQQQQLSPRQQQQQNQQDQQPPQNGYQQPPPQNGYQQPPPQNGYQQPPPQNGYQQPPPPPPSEPKSTFPAHR